MAAIGAKVFAVAFCAAAVACLGSACDSGALLRGCVETSCPGPLAAAAVAAAGEGDGEGIPLADGGWDVVSNKPAGT